MSRLRFTWSLFVFALLTGCSIAPVNNNTSIQPGQSTPVANPSATSAPPAKSVPPGSSPAMPPASSTPPAPPVPSYPLLTLGTHSASVLRLQQLLAEMHYLPLTFQTNGSAASQSVTPNATPTVASPVASQSTTPNSPNSPNGGQNPATASDLQPQQGTWSWSYPHVPPTLKQIWTPGTYTVLTEGAVMSFERTHGMAVDGVAGPQVWRSLLLAATAHQVDPHGYSYVVVTKSQPERLVLWYQGKDVYSFPANTGISQSPTPNGTWPVYLRFTSQTMSGQNPNGTHYSDPGVPWVNYFYQGDAVHGFIRSSYGYPQSLGCVELPIPDAQDVWNYVHYGTLVTVQS